MKNLKMFAIGLAAFAAMTMGVHAMTYKGDNALDFASCLNASTDSVCTLTKSGAIAGATVHKNVTLNLEEGVVLTLNGFAISVQDGASLTVNGGEIKRTDTTDANILVVKEGGSLTTKAVKLTSTAVAPSHDDQSVIAVDGGSNTSKVTKVSIGKDTTVSGYAGLIVYPTTRNVDGKAENVTVDLNGTWNTVGYTIQTQGRIKTTTNVPVINVNGGSYTSTKNVALYAAGQGKWTIAKGVKVTGDEAIYVKSGEVTVDGGEFIATGDCNYGQKHTDSGVTSNAYATGAALSVYNQAGYANGIKVVVNDGTFKSACSVIAADVSGNDTIAIKGGSYESPKNVAPIRGNATAFVQGGTFSSSLTASYIASNLSQVTINGVTYVGAEYKVTTEVTEENGKVDSIMSPATAIAGAKVIIADYVKVTPNEGYVAIYKVVDVDGKEVSVTDGSFVMPESDVTVTVTFVVKTEATEPTVPGDEEQNNNVVVGDEANSQQPAENIQVAKTGDNIVTYMGLGLASLAVVALGSKNLKKQTN